MFTLLIVVFHLSLYFLVQHGVLLPSFRALERQESMEDATRVMALLQREIYYLDSLCLDWAWWDDTYDYTKSGDANYEESNLTDTSFTDNKLNLIFILDIDGKVKFGRICEFGHKNNGIHDLSLPEFPKGQWPSTHPLLQHNESQRKITGLLRTSRGAMMVAARPILTSNNLGPVRGTLVMGRFCDAKTAAALGETARVPVRLELLPETPVAGMMIERADSPRAFAFAEESDRLLRVSTIVPDIQGKPLLRLHITTDRNIMRKGQNVMDMTLWAMGFTGLAVFIAVLIFLQRSVLGPLMGLTRHVARVGREKDLVHVDLPPRNDEIGSLATEFNRMVQRIQDDRAERERAEADLRVMQERVLRAEHLATLGEMGASVAHEMRNPLAGLSAALQVLRGELAENDSRREVMEEALAQIRRMDHIIGQLLLFARPWEPCKAPVDLRALAEKISGEAANAHAFAGIRIVVEGDGTVMAPVDAALVGQIMHNLMSNAADAIRAAAPDVPMMRWTFRETADSVALILHDNGGGLAPDARSNLFRPFFTTKTHGTGLGLAICRRIVEAHGGTISIEGGNGHGTTATVSFPKGL